MLHLASTRAGGGSIRDTRLSPGLKRTLLFRWLALTLHSSLSSRLKAVPKKGVAKAEPKKAAAKAVAKKKHCKMAQKNLSHGFFWPLKTLYLRNVSLPCSIVGQ